MPDSTIPYEPEGKQMNLFTYVFKLAQNSYIPIYEYPLSPTMGPRCSTTRRRST